MEKDTILIVDDSNLNRKVLVNTLSEDYNTLEATNGIEALSVINKHYSTISLILLDIMMPELNGIEVLKIIKSQVTTSSIPVILITAADSNEEYAFELGAVDFIAKPFNTNVVKSRVNTHVNLKNYSNKLEMLVAYDLNKNEKLWTDITSVMSAMICKRDTGEIELERAKYCKRLTSLLVNGLIENNVANNSSLITSSDEIINFMPLRDIGMAGVSDEIIFKSGKLTDAEYMRVQKHTIDGGEVVSCIGGDEENTSKEILKNICLYHHENYDGSGYPSGLAGNEIPIEARIAAVVDCYDAMVSTRYYRNAYDHDYVVKYMQEEKGKKFDPAIIDIFLLHKNEIESIYDGSDIENE